MLPLTTTCLFAVAVVAFAARRPRFTLGQRFIYLFGRTMARWRWHAEVIGELPTDLSTGAIIVCNHRSPFDPAFIQLKADRVVHWMVAREYCEHPLLAWLFRSVQAIPVGRRGVDTAATKLAIRYAQAGEWVGMFPEGRINKTDEPLLPGRPGAAMVAMKARVPVIPCHIAGSPMGKTVFTAIFKSAKPRLVIGPPLDISAYYGREKEPGVREELTLRFLQEIARLGGRADYQPQLAGRQWKTDAE
jgi:1-acyl-sn-glycerol-3-phosphate acyltransferase